MNFLFGDSAEYCKSLLGHVDHYVVHVQYAHIVNFYNFLRPPLIKMRKILWIWSLLSACHLGLVVLSTVLGIDTMSAIIAGTIYLPLWPVNKLSLPVFQVNQWMIPPPNFLGWTFVVVFWGLLYLAIATSISRFLQRR